MLSTKGKPATRAAVQTTLVLATSLLASGCLDIGNVFGPAAGECGIAFGTYPCVLLAVDPATNDQVRLLKGDTLRFTARSDSGYGSVTWSIDTGSVAIVTPDGVSNSVAGPSSTVLVRGIGVGIGHVTATHFTPLHTASSAVHVVDSSSVALISIGYSSAISMKLRDSVWLGATLRDSTGATVRGAAEAWESSDSTVAFVTVRPATPCSTYCYLPGPGVYVHARAAGIVTITARFRGVRSSISVLSTQ